jgi:hypothetical protein
MNSIQTTAASADAGTTGAVVQRTITEGEQAPEAHDTPTRDPDTPTTVFALVFWVILLGLGGFFYFRSNSADVFLNVITQSQSGDAAAKPVEVLVDGAVLVDGRPVTNGQLQISVHDADRKSYLASAVVPTLDGSFKTNFTLPAVAIDQKLRVDASYLGFSEAESEREKVIGSISRFVRAPDPLGTSRVVTLLSVLAGLIILLIILFTGELTRPKARLLFIATYFVTFVALVLPIALTVLLTRNPYLADIMREAPIGLVKGVSGETVKKEQWLLNIGGTVRPTLQAAVGTTISSSTTPATPTQTPPTGAAPGRAVAAAASPTPAPLATPGAGSAPPGGAGAAADGTTTTPPARQAQVIAPTAATSNGGLRPTQLQNVDGGLVVPFYILILAMFGAGINMTRQVPQIQSAYDEKITPRRESVLIATLHAPLKMFQYAAITNPAEREAAAHIRKQLIDSYMYLLAAPFLAIAVYYLLQVLAENTAEPVLVLMAFSTGLVSDAIVTRITSFAEQAMAGAGGTGQPQPAQPQPQAQQPAQVQLQGQLAQRPAAQTSQAPHSQARAAQSQSKVRTEAQEAIAQEVHDAEVVGKSVQREANEMFAQVKEMLNIPERVGPTATLETPTESPAPARTNETKETVVGKEG